jgi:hypothetical protein
VLENGSTHPGYILSINSSRPKINNIGKMVVNIPVFVAFGLLHTDFAKEAFMDICVDKIAIT